MKARMGWLHVKEFQDKENGNELVDIPLKAQELTFYEPHSRCNKQYIKVVIIPVEED